MFVSLTRRCFRKASGVGEIEEVCFRVRLILLGCKGVLLKPAARHVADEARGAWRKKTLKALLKYCLFLLTFSALASIGQFWQKETVMLGGSPSGGSPCLAYKKKTKPPSLLGGEADRGDFGRWQERPATRQCSARRLLSLPD